jgi:D-galactarolactone cycloisomerase
LREIFNRKAMDIIQPNVTRSGGFTECMRIAVMAEAFHVPYAPHTGGGTAVCMAAELHLAAAPTNFLIYEHMQSDWSKAFNNPLRTGIVKQSAERFEKGYMLLPPGPGLGIELNDEVINRYHLDLNTAGR